MQQNFIYQQIINSDFSVLVHKYTIFIDDNQLEVGKVGPHSILLNPGDDYSSFDSTTQSICEMLWTPEVIANYQQILQDSFNNPLIGN